MYGNYQVGLAVPQIHLKDGNAATPVIPHHAIGLPITANNGPLAQ
jgi:hypothetical protein